MNITNIGDSEQYVYNKSKYLTKLGYEVSIYSAIKGKIVIKEFEKYKKNIIPEIMYSPNCFRYKKVNGVLKRIILELGDFESKNTVIESDGIAEAQWGELLAKELNCKHLFINVQENHKYSFHEKRFLRFKLGQKELSGITDDSVNRMFDYNEEIHFESNHSIKAFCDNVFDSVADN